MTDSYFSGKSAIVTGSTSGIGLAIAEAFAMAGCNVMLNGLEKPEAAQPMVQKLAAHKTKILYSPADMTKPAEIAAMVNEAARGFGGVDILVNNAGIQFTSSVDQFPVDKWDAIIATNLSSAFHAIQHALPFMRKRPWGRIVNIVSAHGLVASVNKTAYVAAKHGLMGLTKSVALETARENITCNGICPGFVLTPLVETQLTARAAANKISVEEAGRQLLSEKHPSLKFIKAEDVAALAVFLCGQSSSSITGAAFSIDGGWTAV